MAKRRKKRNNILLKNLLICSMSIILLVSTITTCYRVYSLQKKVNEITQELNEKTKEKEQLKNVVENLQDKDYSVRYARDNYAYIKKGEIVVKIPNKPPK